MNWLTQGNLSKDFYVQVDRYERFGALYNRTLLLIWFVLFKRLLVLFAMLWVGKVHSVINNQRLQLVDFNDSKGSC